MPLAWISSSATVVPSERTVDLRRKVRRIVDQAATERVICHLTVRRGVSIVRRSRPVQGGCSAWVAERMARHRGLHVHAPQGLAPADEHVRDHPPAAGRGRLAGGRRGRRPATARCRCAARARWRSIPRRLLALEDDPHAYGTALGEALFRDGVRDAFVGARAADAGRPAGAAQRRGAGPQDAALGAPLRAARGRLGVPRARPARALLALPAQHHRPALPAHRPPRPARPGPRRQPRGPRGITASRPSTPPATIAGVRAALGEIPADGARRRRGVRGAADPRRAVRAHHRRALHPAPRGLPRPGPARRAACRRDRPLPGRARRPGGTRRREPADRAAGEPWAAPAACPTSRSCAPARARAPAPRPRAPSAASPSAWCASSACRPWSR